MMKLLAAIALAAGAIALSAASAPAGAVSHRPFSFLSRFAAPAQAVSPKPAKKATGFNCVSSCASYEATINQYFTDVAADSVANATTNVYSVLPQYSGILYSSTFAGSYVDPNSYPKSRCKDGGNAYCVTDGQIQTEIGRAIAANGWPTQSTDTLYFLFTPANVGVCQRAGSSEDKGFPAPCTTNVFCAYHHASTKGGGFIYAVEPDNAAIPNGGCDTGQYPAGNNADATINTISHEEIEAITDPFGGGYWTEDPEQQGEFSGAEIGDLCAWNFGADLGQTLSGASYNQVINGHEYYLQQEWSNADGGCVQTAGGTVTTPVPGDHFYNGTGPLVYHNGSVMTGPRTVYAIYWIPSRPENVHPPKIAGQTQVGKRLRALDGAWTNFPPTFAYRWLRCSAKGTSCTAIRKATDDSYLLTPNDAGHTIEVRVIASNQAGSASAFSLPTAKVRP